MIAIGWVVNILQQGIASTIRAMNLLNTKPEVIDRSVNKKIISLQGNIKIKNLSFSYEKNKEPVLKNINLIIPKNSTLGILGKHGSGKTTIITLLFKIFNVNDGTIFIDNNDINKIPINVLRNSIGYVPQEMLLFSDTIKNNILLGINESEENNFINKVQYYSQIASFDKDIKSFHDNFLV